MLLPFPRAVVTPQRLSQGNASNAPGALSGVKMGHKDTSGAIFREKKKLFELPFVAKK